MEKGNVDMKFMLGLLIWSGQAAYYNTEYVFELQKNNKSAARRVDNCHNQTPLHQLLMTLAVSPRRVMWENCEIWQHVRSFKM